jgi:hypothetical protein
MKTSLQLLTEFGEPIPDFYFAFSTATELAANGVTIEPGDSPSDIVGISVVGQEGQVHSRAPAPTLLKSVDQPFVVDGSDEVYLHAECYYSEGATTTPVSRSTACSGL